MDRDGGGGLHLVMLPWLALGHLLPFFELSKRIAAVGHRVSFLSTPRNIRRLPELPPRLAPLIHLVELPLPHVAGLPSGAEATIDLPSHDLRPHLKMAYDKLEDQLYRFLEESSTSSSSSSSSAPVDWIVFDYSPYWVPRVAARFGVPCAYLGLFSAGVLSFYGPPSALLGDSDDAFTTPEQLTVPPKWIPFPSKIAYRGYEARELFKPGIEHDASGVSEAYRFGAAIAGCQIAAVRSCPELEPRWLSLLAELYQKPVVPVGLLPPVEDDTGDAHADGWRGGAVVEWLSKQQQGSVVYIAFGSEVKLSCAQTHEIALGLEQCGLPFVWALRTPFDVVSDELEAALPGGFEERNEHRGLVCRGWVQQVRILAHPSVGGFLTHGGWNSIVEGLALGRALALLPLLFDQGLNSRDLVERGIGVEVPRDEADGSFTGDAISRTLRLVMVDEEGETFRAKARESKAIFGNREVQDRCLKHFVEQLVDRRRQGTVSLT